MKNWRWHVYCLLRGMFMVGCVLAAAAATIGLVFLMDRYLPMVWVVLAIVILGVCYIVGIATQDDVFRNMR